MLPGARVMMTDPRVLADGSNVKSKPLPLTFDANDTGGPWLQESVVTFAPFTLKHQSAR